MQILSPDGRLGVRPLRLDDVPAHFAAIRESLAELCRWMPWAHPDYSIKDCEDFVSKCPAAWEKGEEHNFVIFDTKDGSDLGAIGLNQINRTHSFANLGYWVRTSRTRQGIAPAATRMIAQFGLKELGLNRVEIVAAVENKFSQRVAEKAGARREGVLRKGLQQNGRPHDAVMYSFIAEDFNP